MVARAKGTLGVTVFANIPVIPYSRSSRPNLPYVHRLPMTARKPETDPLLLGNRHQVAIEGA